MIPRFSKQAIARAIVIVFVLALIAWANGYAKALFAARYGSYTAASKAQQDAAYLPGTTGNPLRQSLNETLSQALTAQISPAQRLSLAEQGLSMIALSNTQVDAIGNAAPRVTASIAEMEKTASNPFYIYRRGDILKLTGLARTQMATIEDIRGLSYRANFETAQIFQRIITDHGTLTADYTRELNDQIPAVEGEFNKREDLYFELESSANSITNAFTNLQGSF